MGWPIQVGVWTPLVRPRISCGLMPFQVAFAVCPWSSETALAPWVMRRHSAVMSNCDGVVLDAEPQGQQALDRHAARARAAVAVEQGTGDAAHEVGVEALVARGDRACGS